MEVYDGKIKNKDFDRYILGTLEIGNNNILWKDAMHICFCVDENYVKYAGVMLLSVVKNNMDSNIVFHIFCDKILGRDVDYLRKYTEEYKNIEVKIYFVNHEEIKDFPETEGSWNLSIYYRAIAPHVLYGVIDRLLYTDVDMCCVGRLDDLFFRKFDGFIACVVKDAMGDASVQKRLKELGCVNNKQYFNSGLILFDINCYFEAKILEQFISVIKEKKSKLSLWDQDALNIVIGDKVLYVGNKFNNQIFKTTIDDLRVIHYIGNRKPWFNNIIRYDIYNLWLDVYYLSPWRYVPLDDTKYIDYSEYRYQAKFYWEKGNKILWIKSIFLYLKLKIKMRFKLMGLFL